MPSRKVSTPKTLRGFSLIEMLVVIGVLVLIASFSACFDFSNYQSQAFRSERGTIITLLETARADALTNVDQSPHGVALHPADHPGSYVLFEGLSYAESDSALHEVVDSSYAISMPSTEVVFSQLSGDSSYSGNITLTDPVRGMTSSITLNHEGQISW